MSASSFRKLLVIFMVAVLTIVVAAPAFAAGGTYSDAQIKDIIYRLLNFSVFAIILFVVLRKPLPKFFRERREAIARNLEYLETQSRNLDEQREMLNKQIAEIASERDAILAQYERMGQKEAERLIADAKTAAENIIKKTEAAMDLEIKSARQALMNEIVKLSTETAAELVKENINQDDQKRLTGEFMAQVEKLKTANQ